MNSDTGTIVFMTVAATLVTQFTLTIIREGRARRRSERDKVRVRLLTVMVERMKHMGPYR